MYPLFICNPLPPTYPSPLSPLVTHLVQVERHHQQPHRVHVQHDDDLNDLGYRRVGWVMLELESDRGCVYGGCNSEVLTTMLVRTYGCWLVG